MFVKFCAVLVGAGLLRNQQGLVPTSLPRHLPHAPALARGPAVAPAAVDRAAAAAPLSVAPAAVDRATAAVPLSVALAARNRRVLTPLLPWRRTSARLRSKRPQRRSAAGCGR